MGKQGIAWMFGQFAQPQLLEFVGTVTIQATTKSFVPAEKFVVADVPVRICWLGNNFRDWFLGKTEEPDAEAKLCYAKLRKPSVDDSILVELGNKAETTLAQIYALMEKQANGEAGVLLINGYANIFYMQDVNSNLRAVVVRWVGDGWRVDADSIENPNSWFSGGCVFSRNS